MIYDNYIVIYFDLPLFKTDSTYEIQFLSERK
jgi:hypothetical protein